MIPTGTSKVRELMETCGNCGGNEQLWKLCAASKPMGLGNSLGLLADVKLCLKTLGNLDPSLLLTMIFHPCTSFWMPKTSQKPIPLSPLLKNLAPGIEVKWVSCQDDVQSDALFDEMFEALGLHQADLCCHVQCQGSNHSGRGDSVRGR